MALWEAYVDESGDGKGKDPVFVLGGYLIRSDHAKDMAEKWARALRRVGVPYFHMVDCAHGSGAFKDIPREKRDWLARRCISLIKDKTEIGICFILNTQKSLEGFESAYTHSVLAMAGHFASAIIEKDADARFAIVYEAGHSSEGHARKTVSTVIKWEKVFPNGHVPSISFVPKSESCLIQAADLVAWQAAKYVKDIATKSGRSARKDFLALVKDRHTFYYQYQFEGEVNEMRDKLPGTDDKNRAKFIEALFGNQPSDADFLRQLHATHPQELMVNPTASDVLTMFLFGRERLGR